MLAQIKHIYLRWDGDRWDWCGGWLGSVWRGGDPAAVFAK